jgi:hypothetical protein
MPLPRWIVATLTTTFVRPLARRTFEETARQHDRSGHRTVIPWHVRDRFPITSG